MKDNALPRKNKDVVACFAAVQRLELVVCHCSSPDQELFEDL